MKRVFTFTLCIFLLVPFFSGCSSKTLTVRIAGVMNSPYAQLSHMLENNSEGTIYDSTSVNLPNRIRTIMSEGECDVAVIPLETACSIYNRAYPEVKILAGISVGGFELISTEEIKDISKLKDKTIYLTERNTLMESVLEYLLKFYKVDMYYDVTFEYVESIETLQKSFEDKTASFALLNSAEAAQIKAEVDNINTYNITDELAKKFKKPSIITYCVIGTTEFIDKNPETVEKLLKDIEASISKSDDFENTIKLAKKHSILTDDIYDKNFLSELKLDFISGDEMQKKLTAYFKLIKKIKPSMVNNIINKDNLFYIPEK